MLTEVFPTTGALYVEVSCGSLILTQERTDGKDDDVVAVPLVLLPLLLEQINIEINRESGA